MSTRTKTVQVRLTKAERKKWQAEADRRGVTLSELIREVCNWECNWEVER